MLLSRYVDVGLNSLTINYYRNLGYDIPQRINKYGKLTIARGTRIRVNIADLPEQSEVKVKVKCDYCGKIFSKEYRSYLHSAASNGDCCSDCISIKCKKILLEKYGVTSIAQVPLASEHKKETFLKHYGVTNYTKTQEYKLNNSKENHWNWHGGISGKLKLERNSYKYKEWREAVFQRDNYTCQCCGDKTGHNLEAHHIENFSDHNVLRFNVDNGITLCKKCHNPNQEGSFHNLYGTRNNTKEQLEEYLHNHCNMRKESPHSS